MTTEGAETPATIDDVKEILGSGVDRDLVVDILHTGASRKEILEALEWLEDDDYMGAELARALSARAQRVYDILDKERGDDPERG